jgi:hypothetical protein
MPTAAALKIPQSQIQGVPLPPPAYVLQGMTGSGVLGLLEPGHPRNPVVGVPANGATMPDLAAEWTGRTLGVAPGGFAVGNTIPASGSTKAFAERTAKGGLHVASAQSGATSPYENISIGMGTPRKNYLDAAVAAGHAIFLSIWGRKTRDAAAGYTSAVQFAGVRRGGNLSDIYAAVGLASNAAWTSPSTTSGQSRLVGATAENQGAGNFFAAVTAQGALTGAFSTSNNMMVLGASNVATLNVLPGQAFYRVYFEDLTLSGRSHASVAAAERQEYVDQVLSSTGRYFGDTWTNPTTVLA